MQDLTARFDAYWDETQEHRVIISQDMEGLRADMRTVMHNQATILRNQQSLQNQLAQATVMIWAIAREVHYTHSCSFIDIEDTVHTYLGGGGGGGGGDWFVLVFGWLLCLFLCFLL